MKIVRISLTCLTVALASCGGGGGSNSSVIQGIDGTWRGSLALESDLCGLKVDPLSEVHEVSIDGDQVTLISTNGRVLEGLATSPTSFDVQISDGEAFPTIDQVKYSAITNGNAQVEITHTFSRPGGCVSKWVGEMAIDQ